MNSHVQCPEFTDMRGQTITVNAVRVWFGACTVRVTDLTNAGKRGKKCDEFAIFDLDMCRNPMVARLIGILCAQLKAGMDFAEARAFADDIMTAVGNAHDYVKLTVHTKRGVDTKPADMADLVVEGPGVRIEVDYREIRAACKSDRANAPRLFVAKPAAVAIARQWIAANVDAIKAMSFGDLQSALSVAGCQFHSYCGMD